jgi:hypothetical protein
MSNLQVYPYVATEHGWSISDSVMAAIWMQLEQEGKVEHLFYDGSVRDVSGWLQHLKTPGMYPLVVADTEKAVPVHIAWLNNIGDHIAWAHHCAIGKYRRGVWEAVVNYWKIFDLWVILGLTPETNEKAVKFLERICKFHIVGTVPAVCNLAYEGHRVGGVISYYQMRNGTPE